MKYLCLLIALFISQNSFAKGLVSKLEGTCDEVFHSFELIEKEKDEPYGTLLFEGHEGTVGVSCNGDEFKYAMILFNPETVEMAVALYKALELHLIQFHGDFDKERTAEFAESLYMGELLIGAPGFSGTTAYSIWPANKNNLDLKINTAGRQLNVIVTFGHQN